MSGGAVSTPLRIARVELWAAHLSPSALLGRFGLQASVWTLSNPTQKRTRARSELASDRG